MATTAQVRAEMSRLTDLLLKKSREYDDRERYVTEQNERGATNFAGDLYSVKKRDILLQDLSGASKTIATILTAHSVTLAAEIAYRRHIAVFPPRSTD